MTGIIEQLLLVAILAIAATGLVLAINVRRKTASRLEALSDTMSILIKTSYHNSKQIRESGDLLKNVHTAGLETLAFQRKSHDHQRVLMASLSRQATQISQMLGGTDANGIASGQQAKADEPQPARLPRRAGFRMAPVIGTGKAKRIGTVPFASLVGKQEVRSVEADAPVKRNANVVAVEQLFGELTNAKPQAASDGRTDGHANAADELAAELLGGADMNQMTAQKVANG
ncbi:MAG: hypothetical protein KDJ69_04780 [Nitratireductor sp.]|nr:hypothetical protein [Nitratireductor sp.]